MSIKTAVEQMLLYDVPLGRLHKRGVSVSVDDPRLVAVEQLRVASRGWPFMRFLAALGGLFGIGNLSRKVVGSYMLARHGSTLERHYQSWYEAANAPLLQSARKKFSNTEAGNALYDYYEKVVEARDLNELPSTKLIDPYVLSKNEDAITLLSSTVNFAFTREKGEFTHLPEIRFAFIARNIFRLTMAYTFSRYFSKTREALKEEIARYCLEPAGDMQALKAAYQRFTKGRLANSASKGLIASAVADGGFEVAAHIWGESIDITPLSSARNDEKPAHI